MIYDNEIFAPLELEQTVTALVKAVRDDGKIDLTLGDKASARVSDLAEDIIEKLREHGGSIGISDSSSPDEIKAIFHCSKKDFKKAVGKLYKERRILLEDGGIHLSDNN